MMAKILERDNDPTGSQLQAVLDHAPDAFVSMACDGRIIEWNLQAERMFGWSRAEALGCRVGDLIVPPQARGDHQHGLARYLQTGEARVLNRPIEVQALTKEGGLLPVELTIAAVGDGADTTFNAFLRDISERRTHERELDQQRQAFAEAQAIAQIGSWSWDPETDVAGWSDEMYRIFGRDPADGPATAEDLFAYLHPDDRDRIAAGYAEAFGAGEAFELEYRIVAGSGELRSLHGLGRRESGGRYVGTVQDVTERMRIEHSLRDAEQLLALAFDRSPLGMTVSTPDRRVVRLNQALADMLGYSVQELMTNQQPTRYTHPDDHAVDREQIRALLDGDKHYRQWDKRYVHADGHTVWARVSLSVLRHPDGSPRQFVGQIEDISERRQHGGGARAARRRRARRRGRRARDRVRCDRRPGP